MNFSISVKLDLPIVNLIQIIVYKYAKEEKYSCNTLKVQKRNWSINTVILPACHALAQAHSAGIYHRDLKPDNIMYTSSDRAQIKITDWGLGRDIGRKSVALTASAGQIGGTPGPDSYPIASFSYFLLYKELSTNIDSMEKARALAEFINWAITDEQQFASPLHYVPLPESVVQHNQQTLRSLTFNGQPLLQ
jgi:serine/threonine protein kinase